MSLISIKSPFPYFQDIDGNPLESGTVYIGVAGVDAESNPKTVYWDVALSSAVSQPISTKSGFLVNSDVFGNIYSPDNDYSIKVKNKNGTVVYSSINRTEYISSNEFIQTVSTPNTGFNYSVPADSSNRWTIFNPSTSLSTGTITLPTISNLIDNQEYIFSTTKQINSITFNKSDASDIYNIPSALAVGVSLKIKYNSSLTSWFKV